MSAPMAGEQEQAAVNPGNTCSQGGIIFKSSSPEKRDSPIFTFFVATEENFHLPQHDTLCFNFLNSSQVLGAGLASPWSWTLL